MFHLHNRGFPLILAGAGKFPRLIFSWRWSVKHSTTFKLSENGLVFGLCVWPSHIGILLNTSFCVTLPHSLVHFHLILCNRLLYNTFAEKLDWFYHIFTIFITRVSSKNQMSTICLIICWFKFLIFRSTVEHQFLS